MPKFINDLDVGDEILFKKRYSEEIHNGFRDYSNDKSPIHNDHNFAKKNGYNSKIGYSFFLITHISYLIGEKFPGGSELCVEQKNKFLNVFYIDDDLKFIFKVIQKNKQFKIVTINIIVYNQNDIELLKSEIVLKLSLHE